MALVEANVGPQNSMPLIITGSSNHAVQLANLHKEEGLWSSSQAVIFCCFSRGPNLCVVQHLKEYEKQTEAFWTRSRAADNPPFSSPVFGHIDQWHLSVLLTE